MIRLDKYLADAGAASRREAKAYIRRGEVTVDGVPARAPEQKIAETAVVCLCGQVLRYQAYHYYMLHKPRRRPHRDGRPQSADGARSVPAGAAALRARARRAAR